MLEPPNALSWRVTSHGAFVLGERRGRYESEVVDAADLGPPSRSTGLDRAGGIFSNAGDDRAGLEDALNEHLDDVSVRIVRCVALFTGKARAR